jgi:DNA-binding XRE family transcriptional regulator
MDVSKECDGAISGVKECLLSPTRIRFDSVLNTLKLKWSDVYKSIGVSKCYASQIRNGHLNPPNWLKVKIAQAMKTDTSVLWPVEIETGGQHENKT